jgi:hypothetical protein
VGCQVQGDGRPVRSRRDGRPPAELLNLYCPNKQYQQSPLPE